MKKSIRRFLFTALAITMAVLMASINTVQVFAAGRGDKTKVPGGKMTGNTYIKDVIIVTESEASNLDGTAYGDYKVLSTPLSSPGNGHEKLFFAVQTTTNPNEAITDIKAMNMNGDYSFDAYGNYLAEVEKWTQAKADTTMKAVAEFKANYKAGKPGALFAYEMLNYFVGDNSLPLGEYFVSDDNAATLGIQVKNLVMKANLAMLEFVRQLLLVACSDTNGEKDFVSELLKHDAAHELTPNDGNNLYNTAAIDLINSMGNTRDAILNYRKEQTAHGNDFGTYIEGRLKEIGAILNDNEKFGTDEYDKASTENTYLKSVLSGFMLCSLFDSVYYIDNNFKKYSLSDILVKDPDAEKKEDQLTPDLLLPVVTLMSEGQRGLAGCGFDKLVGSVINDYSGENSEHQESLNQIRELWGSVADGELISIYSGVDLSLYDPNGIAMVGKSGEFLHDAAGEYRFLGVSSTAAYCMLGGAVVGIAGSCAALKLGVPAITRAVDAKLAPFGGYHYRLEEQLARATENFTKIRAKSSAVFAKYENIPLAKLERWELSDLQHAERMVKNSVAAEQYNELQGISRSVNRLEAGASFLKAFSYFMIAVSVVLLVFSIVTLVMNAIHKDDPTDYIQVPRVLVNAIEKEEYDERQQKTTKTQLIFYKGIIDPFMSDQKAKDNKTPSKVMDVLDWSLKVRGREWIALYTTKDGRAGHPIMFNGQDKTLVVLVGDSSTYAALEQGYGYNGRVNIFNKTNYTACGDGIIVYKYDPDAISTTTTGLGVSGSMSISNGQFIFFLVLAVTVGAGIGIGVCLIIKKCRKKEEVTDVTL